nr:phospholipase A2 inhibitor subunit gamma B-like [Pelodiscus sinensis]|eukprot:XP_025039179.1 phospholipase A2 inhibitor subunit gamma B-like [Pelodiscus sinensis]
MTVSLAVCLLAALLGTGAGLQCEVCAAEGHNCSGSLQPCPAGQDSCGIFLTEVTLAEVKSQSILKSCVTSSQCKAGPGSVDFGYQMTRRVSVACCVGDACRNTSVPPFDAKPNGRRCRGCFVSNTDHCTEQIIYCSGAETRCINAAGTILTAVGNLTQSILKGCASESVCAQLKVGPATVAGISANLTTAKCLAQGPARFLLPALAGLLLNLLSPLPTATPC